MVMALIVIFAIILVFALMNVGKPSGETHSDNSGQQVPPMADMKSEKVADSKDLKRLETMVHTAAIEDISQEMAYTNDRTEMQNRLNGRLSELIDELAEEEGLSLSRTEKDAMRSALIDEMLGFGPLQKFLDAGDVSEICVLSHDQITVTRNFHAEKTGAKFNNAEHLNNIIERMTAPFGIRLTRAEPVAKVMLPGGHEAAIDLSGSEKSSPILKITKSR